MGPQSIVVSRPLLRRGLVQEAVPVAASTFSLLPATLCQAFHVFVRWLFVPPSSPDENVP